MKGLKKLILATAITAATTSAFAMQALDDDTMSNTTGQDGLTITLGTDVTIGALRIHDKDGLKQAGALTPLGTYGTGYDNYFTNGGTNTTTDATVSGSIVIQGPIHIYDAATTTAGTVLTIDAGSQASGSAPVLHVGVSVGPQIIDLGGVKVQVASGDGKFVYSAGGPSATTATTADILTFDAGTQLTTGGASLNIDLGNQPTGHLISGSSTLTADGSGNVLTLSSLNIMQGTTEGIGISGIAIKPHTGTTVTTDITVDVVAGGLRVGLTSADGQDIGIQDIKLGTLATAASIGSVYIDNLTTAAQTITISGH